MRSSARLATGVALLIMSGACATDTTTTTSVETTTSSSVSSTTEDTAAPTTTSTTAQIATTTTEQPTTTTPATFPPARQDLEHGGSAWAVILAGATAADDAALADATRAAEDAGYTTGPTDCDEGAGEALGQPDGAFTVSVYFDTEADAVAAASAFESRGVNGVVAEVQTFCLD